MNMGIYEVIIVYSIILSTIMVISIIRYLNQKNNIIKTSNDMNVMMKLKLEDINANLDILLNEVFNEYMMINILHKDIKYIHDDLQKDIIKNICKLCSEKVSDSLMYQLSLYYADTSIADLIAHKVYFIVNNYCIQYNMPRNNSKK